MSPLPQNGHKAQRPLPVDDDTFMLVVIGDMLRNSAASMAKFHRLKILGTLNKPVDEVALGEALAKLA